MKVFLTNKGFKNLLKRRISKVILTFALLFAFSIAVFADQAEWISQADAKKAVKLLKDKKEIKHFCKPCGDIAATDEEITSVEMEKIKDQEYWNVKINGNAVDLAYVYFKDSEGKWKNLAMHFAIEVSDVPEYISE